MTLPMAVGGEPSWPLPETLNPIINEARDFEAWRDPVPPDKGPRVHPGVDLKTFAGATLVAMETGELIAEQGWRPGVRALLLRTDSGIVVVYGGVEPESYRHFGLQLGDRVRRGEPIALVGTHPGGSTLAHMETWRGDIRRHVKWYQGDPPPDGLLDPRQYLARARKNGHVVEPEVLPGPAPVPKPVPRPAPRPLVPSASDGGGGAVAVALLTFVGFAMLGGDDD